MSRRARGKGAVKESTKGPKKNKPAKTPPVARAKKCAEELGRKEALEQRNEESDTERPVDLEEARERVSDLVRKSAGEIASGVIEVAKGGQLASAKYLFEAVGLYPAAEQTAPGPPEDSLAQTLLKRLGIPLEPAVTDEDDTPMIVASDGSGVSDENAKWKLGQEDERTGREGERGLVDSSRRQCLRVREDTVK